MENVSWLWYLVIQNPLMELYKEKLGLFKYLKKFFSIVCAGEKALETEFLLSSL